MVQLVRSDSPDDAGALSAMAQQLAQALRASRLTVVVGAPRAGKSTLLASVLPLLRRRAIDVSPAAGAAARVVVPFPDRRGRGVHGVQRELIHTMDHWDDASLQSLQRALEDDAHGRGRRPVADAMAPASLAAHIDRHGGARLLFVFDHFEEVLEAARTRVGHRRLVETWAAAARSPMVRANFLVAVDERSWPWLRAVCVALPETDWSALRLRSQFGERSLEPMSRPLQVSPLAARRPLGIEPLSGVVPPGANFLQSVNDGVRRVAQSAREQRPRGHGFAGPVPHLPDKAVARDTAEPGTTERAAEAVAIPAERTAAVPQVEAAVPAAEVTSVDASPWVPVVDDIASATPLHAPRETHADAPPPNDRALVAERAVPARRRSMPMLPGLAVLVIGVGLAIWWWRATFVAPPEMEAPAVSAAPQDSPASAATPPTATAAAAPQPAPPPEVQAAPAAGPGVYAVLGVSADGEHARVARELIAALPGDVSPPRIEPLARDADPVAWLQQAPGRLSIARFDALRAAPHGDASVPLQVLTPLFAEPVLFVVRADSPLRTIRQLQGRRISVGPMHSDASHTVRELYRRLVGVPLTNTVALTPDQALAELVAFQSIDAMALVDAQPMVWWSNLDPAMARRLRVLTLNPRHPQDQRLLQSLGTAPMRIPAPGGQGAAATVPAVMSYLVASGDDDTGADRLAAMAQALCRELPQLQKAGHPAWRDVRPRAQLDTGWPVVHAFRATVSRCVRR